MSKYRNRPRQPHVRACIGSQKNNYRPPTGCARQQPVGEAVVGLDVGAAEGDAEGAAVVGDAEGATKKAKVQNNKHIHHP